MHFRIALMISDWNDLKTLLAIADSGSLSAAGRRLGVSQSTVSRRLNAMELQAGTQLIVRSADGRISASDAGGVLLEAARRMQEAFDDAQARLSRQPRPIRIASCEMIARLYLADALPLWAATGGAPTELAVHDDLFQLPDDAFDVLLTPMDSAPDAMVGRRIGTLQWSLYAAPEYLEKHPFTGTLERQSAIGASGSLAGIAAYRWFARQGGKTAFSASSPAAHLEAARRGVGVAMLPDALVAGTGLSKLDYPDCPRSDVWMLTHGGENALPLISDFLRWSHRHFRNLAKSL